MALLVSRLYKIICDSCKRSAVYSWDDSAETARHRGIARDWIVKGSDKGYLAYCPECQKNKSL